MLDPDKYSSISNIGKHMRWSRVCSTLPVISTNPVLIFLSELISSSSSHVLRSMRTLMSADSPKLPPHSGACGHQRCIPRGAWGGPGPLCPWVLLPLLCPHMVLVCPGAISLGNHPDLSHVGSLCRPQAGTWAVVRPSPQPRCSVNHTAKSVTSGIPAGVGHCVSENLMKS